MDLYEYEKYVTNTTNLKNTLDKYGVAIIPNVLDNNECKQMLYGMWDYFENLTDKWTTPILRNDKTSWRSFYNLFPLHSMLFQHFNVGHSQVAWDIRQNEKIVNIFAHLWNCKKEELLVSFDGLSFNVPPEITNRGWNKNNTWHHTDQSYTRNDLECIQSWVTALDVNKGDATLSFMESSHKYHKEFSQKFNVTEKEDWYKLNGNEEQFYVDKGCSYKKIWCPKGSLVLWDSRLIHCGCEALKERPKQNLRSIIYVCYTPRSLCNTKMLIKKQKAFEELRTTNHWPHKPKMFPKTPRTYGNIIEPITIIDKPILSSLGKKLAGF